MAHTDSSASPHVAFFLPHLGGGGAEKMVGALANGLSVRGYAVDMVLVRAGGVYQQSLSEKVHLIDLDSRNSYLALPRLVAYLRDRRPQVLQRLVVQAVLYVNVGLGQQLLDHFRRAQQRALAAAQHE